MGQHIDHKKAKIKPKKLVNALTQYKTIVEGEKTNYSCHFTTQLFKFTAF